MQKLISQLDLEWPHQGSDHPPISDDRATLLFLLDTYSKHILDVENHPVRRVREALDGFARELVVASDEEAEKILFRLRQFLASYRIDEYSYVQKTFEDFRTIIWEFVDQLAEDFGDEKKEDRALKSHLENLKEAVEANSIDSLKSQARSFINTYVEYQSRKDSRRTKRMDNIKKNLHTVKKQLSDANHTVNVDHLTKAFNRKAFDERIKQLKNLAEIDKKPMSLIALDIDHFKKINDSYGHAIGDAVLQECVKMLQSIFSGDHDFVARIGGEEFVVLLAESSLHEAVKRAEEALLKIRREALIIDQFTIKFTVSMGVAQLLQNETTEEWLKRGDKALYDSKQTGRNKITIAGLSAVKEAI